MSNEIQHWAPITESRSASLAVHHCGSSPISPKPASTMRTELSWRPNMTPLSQTSPPPITTSGQTFNSSTPIIPNFSYANFTPPASSQYSPQVTSLSERPSLDGDSELHDAKRVKVVSSSQHGDSITPWAPFHPGTNADELESYEIDYSQQQTFANNQDRLYDGDVTPGLSRSLYSKSMIPFGDDRFATNSPFTPSLSDEDDILDPLKLPQTSSPKVQISTGHTGQSEFHTNNSFPSSQQLGWEHPQVGSIPSGSGPASDYDPAPTDSSRGIWNGFSSDREYDVTEHQRLLRIAMGTKSMKSDLVSTNGLGPGYNTAAGTGQSIGQSRTSGSSIGPKHVPSHAKLLIQSYTYPHATRTSSSTPSGDEDSFRRKQPRRNTVLPSSRLPTDPQEAEVNIKMKSTDRMAHNDVERKYRMNLKDKITELRNAIPALQYPFDEDGDENGATAHPAAKVSKGTVLTKATEYIHQLEQHNRAILAEHHQLALRLQAFESLFGNSMRNQGMVMPSHSMTLFEPRGFC